MTYRIDQAGAVQVPVASTFATGGSLVSYADPALSYMLAAFKALLNGKLGAAWSKAASQMSQTGAPVVGTYPYEPMPHLALRTWQWPALFMWREKERLFRRTQCFRDAESTGKLIYILPPMPYEMAVRLQPIRVAVRVALDGFIEQFGDPGVNSGANPLTACGLESFEFTSAQYGYLPASENMQQPHPMVEFTFTMRERQSFVNANYATLGRVTVSTQVISETASGASAGVTAAVLWTSTA